MIRPHPESDMKLNILVLGAGIIAMLKKRIHDYHFVETILTDFLKADKKRTPDLFIYTLIFLYSVGIIEYDGYKIRLKTQIEEQQNLLF